MPIRYSTTTKSSCFNSVASFSIIELSSFVTLLLCMLLALSAHSLCFCIANHVRYGILQNFTLRHAADMTLVLHVELSKIRASTCPWMAAPAIQGKSVVTNVLMYLSVL